MILTTEQIDNLKKGLTTESDFSDTVKERSSLFNEQTVKEKVAKVFLEDEDEKWEVIKKNKLKWRIGQRKRPEDYFEDRVWCLFAKMGYKNLNKKRDWTLPFGDKPGESKQIDVFAVNDETIVFVECKHTDEKGKITSFKTELESYQKIYGHLCVAAKELYPGKNLKLKFILATNNYRLSSTDNTRIKALNGLHLSEENIDYFYELMENIGEAAKYQFAGYVFDGNSIPELPNKIPAVRAKMGDLQYYSFSIEPETLLKISYVPHRNRANREGMDTYQRLVKGKRLKEISRFLEKDNGYFPNSIIVNIVTDKPMQFDLAPKVDCKTKARIGVLHLPARYKSALIIDGQHRLLAYAGTDLATKHIIPVVAFENLDADEQIKLFMQINQNQKPVDKNLRNTLDSIILYDSKILAERIRGMRLRIAEDLANDPNSWLNGFVGSGVDDAKITSTAIDLALKMDIFLGQFKKNEMLKEGVFYKGDEEKAYKNFKSFILSCVQYLVENVSEVQQPGEDGYILTNRGLYGYFRCIGDILTLLKNSGETLDKVDDIMDKVKPYLEPLILFFNTKIKENDEETVASLKTSYGGGADTRYMRTFEKVINESKKDFNPAGLVEYWEKFSADNVNKAKLILSRLESIFRSDIVETLKQEFGSGWFNKGISKETKKILSSKMIDYNDNHPDNPTDEQGVIEYNEMIEIILNNWNMFKGQYVEIGATGERREKLQWLNKLAQLKKDISLKPFIDKDNLNFLKQKEELYLV